MLKMTEKQMQAIQRLTNKIHNATTMTTGSFLEGPIEYRLSPLGEGRGEFLLTAHNATDERAWFHKSVSVFARIGVRGGTKILDIQGVRTL